MEPAPFTSIAELDQRYHTLLFDAYGVLINSEHALPGAVALIDSLNRRGKPYFVVTNGSQLTEEATAHHYQKLGLAIAPEQIVSSGALVGNWARENQLCESPTVVLGPRSCQQLMRASGLSALLEHDAEEFDVLVVGNQDGYPLLETLNHIISRLYAFMERGKEFRLVLPNPDLVYPTSRGVGITGGMIAEIISRALVQRFPRDTPRFECLGKPYAPIFAEAKKRAKTSSLVLIGDQLATDIKGARDAGMDSVLMATGLAKFSELAFSEIQPTYLLKALD